MKLLNTKSVHILAVQEDSCPASVEDFVAVEAPLSITLQTKQNNRLVQINYMVTMRSPGKDFELVKGILWSEDLIHHREDVIDMRYVAMEEHPESQNILVHLKAQSYKRILDPKRQHHVVRTSCGICGKESIEDIFKHSCYSYTPNQPTLLHRHILALTRRLSKHQNLFKQTGGVHAAGLFDMAGNIVMVREDIGRHNALDKLVGAVIEKKMVPLSEYGLILSGRASFELVQKAWMAGCPILLAVGPPSDMGIELADDVGMTLVGFLSSQRYNVYTHPGRIRYA